MLQLRHAALALPRMTGRFLVMWSHLIHIFCKTCNLLVCLTLELSRPAKRVGLPSKSGHLLVNGRCARILLVFDNPVLSVGAGYCKKLRSCG